MAEIITCPTGLTGRIRGMKVREERILTDRKLAKSGGQTEALLAACWEETLDPGPYDFGGAKVDWGKVLQGDRFFALLKIREATYGPTYAFAVSCPADTCRALPDAGKRAWFKLMTGADERKLPQIKRVAGDRFMSALLALRVHDIEGVEPKDKRRFLEEELSMRDADALLDEFDRVDCGVETSIEIECQECLRTVEVELPFDSTFFLPAAGRTARRRAATTSSPEST